MLFYKYSSIKFRKGGDCMFNFGLKTKKDLHSHILPVYGRNRSVQDYLFMQQYLYFLPLPHGHDSLRPVFFHCMFNFFNSAGNSQNSFFSGLNFADYASIRNGSYNKQCFFCVRVKNIVPHRQLVKPFRFGVHHVFNKEKTWKTD